MKLIYVASPYSHDEFEVMEMRYLETFRFVAKATANNTPALYYSPIVYFHPMSQEHKLPRDAHYWWDINKLTMDKSDEIQVLMLDGWDKSIGVNMEINYACQKGIPVLYVK